MMKKYLLLLFLGISLTSLSAQDKAYWVCFNVEVDSDIAETFVNSLDKFMSSLQNSSHL